MSFLSFVRLARHPIGARAMLCVLALALGFAATLGLVHRTIHNPLAEHAHAAAPAHSGEAGHGSHGLIALFGDHSDAECRLYDQLSHGPAALCVPALLLPVLLPAASFAYLEGEAIARWVALFEARGPPPAR